MTTTRVHVYLSTGCLHGRHDYCQSMTGHAGSKRPGRCKFCAAACTCPCHTEPAGMVYAPADRPDLSGPLPPDTDPLPLADVIMIDRDPDPVPVDGLTLDTLQSIAQDVTHCGTPMRFVMGRTNWEGPPGGGSTIHTTLRACIPCGATVTTTTNVPS